MIGDMVRQYVAQITKSEKDLGKLKKNYEEYLEGLSLRSVIETHGDKEHKFELITFQEVPNLHILRALRMPEYGFLLTDSGDVSRAYLRFFIGDTGIVSKPYALFSVKLFAKECAESYSIPQGVVKERYVLVRQMCVNLSISTLFLRHPKNWQGQDPDSPQVVRVGFERVALWEQIRFDLSESDD